MWDFTCGNCCSRARISGDGITWRAAAGLFSRPLQYNDRRCRERLTAAFPALRPVGAGTTFPCVKKGCGGSCDGTSTAGAGVELCRRRNSTPLRKCCSICSRWHRMLAARIARRWRFHLRALGWETQRCSGSPQSTCSTPAPLPRHTGGTPGSRLHWELRQDQGWKTNGGLGVEIAMRSKPPPLPTEPQPAAGAGNAGSAAEVVVPSIALCAHRAVCPSGGNHAAPLSAELPAGPQRVALHQRGFSPFGKSSPTPHGETWCSPAREPISSVN